MIKANFKTYASYVTDSLHQWDLNQVLQVSGLNLATVPEVHFSNANTERAIVRQATMAAHVVSVGVPNSLLQDPLRIYAHIGIYEGDTFKVVELVEIPVIPRKRPHDYQIQDADEEIYSFKQLENALANRATKAEAGALSARIDTIVANANKTDGNSELVDIRVGADGKTYPSAGAAVRTQLSHHAALQNAYFANVAVESGQRGEPSNPQRLHATPPVGVNTIKVAATATYKHALQAYSTADYAKKVDDRGWAIGGAVYHDLDPVLFYNVEFLRVDEERMTEADKAAVAVLQSVDLTKTVKDLQDTAAASMDGLEKQKALYGTYYNRVEILPSTISGPGNAYRLHAVLASGVSHFEVYAPDGYDYGVQGYTSDDYSTRAYDSGWLQGENNLHGMDPALFYNIEFRRTDGEIMPGAAASGIVVLQSLSLTDIVDGLVSESAKRIAPYYDASRDFVRSIAHRGYSSEAPENTAPAFILAKQKGFQYVETDIQVTADGKYVCVHDELCGKYTGGALQNAVSTYTLAELQAQDWGTWKGEKWAGTKILTFEEFAALCKHLSLKMYIELKFEHSESDVAYYIDHLKKLGVLNNVSWLPGEHINTVRSLHPSARVAITGSVAPTEEWIERYKADYQTEEGELFFDLDVSCVTPELSDNLTAAGIPLEVWTVNDMGTVDALLDLNVCGITTDSLIVGAELLTRYGIK